MGRVIEEVKEVKEYTDLSSLLAALNKNTDKLLSSLTNIRQVIASSPYLTAATGNYHYILGEASDVVIAPGQQVDIVNQKGSGFLIAAAIAGFGSPFLDITVETSAKGYLNTFTESFYSLFYGGFARSSLFRLLLYDPVGQIFTAESIPQNFYVWYDDYAKISLTNQSSNSMLYSYRTVLAQLQGSSKESE